MAGRFRPKLGRIRQTKMPSRKKLMAPIQRAVQLAGGPSRFGAASKAKLKYRGRGAGARYRQGFAGLQTRRVIVKTRLVRTAGIGSPMAALGAVRAHLNYLERESAPKDHQNELEITRDSRDSNSDLFENEVGLYGPGDETVDKREFLNSVSEDRHHFRIIVSPEDGHELQSLTAYTRDLMKGVEEDLGTKLEWVAVNHYNTDHPHTHIILRGKDELGKDLVIARDYIAHGFRRRASEHLSLELGPRSDRDIAASLKREVDQMRFTRLDRDLMRMAERNEIGFASPDTSYDLFKQGLLKARLNVLSEMGLATEPEKSSGVWRLSSDMRETLTRIGERGDIIRTMQRQMTATKQFQIFENGPNQSAVMGEIVSVGLSDELNDLRYVTVRGFDDQGWCAVLGRREAGTLPAPGALITLSPSTAEIKISDRTIDEIASLNQGVYSSALHSVHDGHHSDTYLKTHQRRLESLRRQGIVERQSNGDWQIPNDFLQRIENMPLPSPNLDVRSWVPLSELIRHRGETVLETLKPGDGNSERLRKAIQLRQEWLIKTGLAKRSETGLTIDHAALAEATSRSLQNACERLATHRGKSFFMGDTGSEVIGKFSSVLDLPNGRYAVIERQSSLTLVPWKPMLGKYRGQQVAARLQKNTVQWRVGRQIGLPPM